MGKRQYAQINIDGQQVKVKISDIEAIRELVDNHEVGMIGGDGYWLETPWIYDDDIESSEVVGAIIDGVDFCGLN